MDFNNTGSMRSPFSPRVRQSITGRRPIGVSSAKKNQNKFMQAAEEPTGDVIYKTPLTTIETYGIPLPVMVTEALTFASGDLSVRLSPCGWCWVVSGRRVLCWPRSASSSGVSSPAPGGSYTARELTLPQTDLAHKADLVVLFYGDEAQLPSCIGVSPEGTVRYWPCVGQEAVYVDVSCELAGQECERLADCARCGLLLATTTCTLVLLNPTVIDGRATVTCRTLRPPSGWLGGIGRKVSLLFFGSMPAHADTKLVGVVVLEEPSSAESTIVLVSGGPALQIWRGAELYEHSLRRALTEAHARSHLAAHGDLNSLEIMALDVRASGTSGLLLLIATVNVARSPEMRYAIAHVCVAEAAAPRVLALLALRGGAPEPELAPRFLPLPRAAVLYSRAYVAVVPTTSSAGEADYIDVSADGDRLLGAELCGGVPLLFSRKHGVLALTAHDSAPSACAGPAGSPCPSDAYDGNLSLYEIDPHEVGAVTADACGQLKTAFLFHVRRDAAACRRLLQRLFPAPPQPDERDVDAELDRTVLAIATEMLDDMPAGDPRWQRRGGAPTNVALGSSAALQILAQLRDKQRAFALFVDFLRAEGLWQRLGLVSAEGGGATSTESALGALAEQLAAALALRRLQQAEHAQLIDAAVYQVACGAGADEEEPWAAAVGGGALSPSDVCFRRASRAGRVLLALARAAPLAPAAALHTVRVITTVVGEMHRCRAQWSCGARAAQLSPRELLPALVDLHRRVVADVAHDCADGSLRAQLLEAAAALADQLLTDAAQLQQHRHRQLRRDVIRPFVDEGQVERAAALAEKFEDFELLVEMCVDADDWDRLYTYIDKYPDEGVAELAFARLADGGGAARGALLRRLGPRHGAALRAWLARAPARAPLLALHLLAAPQLERAARALLRLAADERGSLARLATAASLGKLCAAAADAEPAVRRALEARLALAEQHAALPRDVRLHHGLDSADMRVLPPEELVQMYVDSESRALTEYDYKKALDLTDFVEDMERRDELRLRVWCACIRRDSWTESDASPDELLQRHCFFRLIDLVHVMGGDLELLLPPLDDILTAPELAELVSDPQFHFMIKYGYECIDTTKNDDVMEA